MIETFYLKGTKEAIIADLQKVDDTITELTELEYPNIGGKGFGHFVGKIMVEPPEIDNEGNVTKEAVMTEEYHFNLWLYKEKFQQQEETEEGLVTNFNYPTFETKMLIPPTNPVNKLA